MTDCLDHTYRAEIDGWNLDPSTMTDQGYRIDELDTIGSCVLTPGDPSPVGRTPDSDLAYVVLPTEDHLYIKRTDAADLAMLLATSMGVTDIKAIPDTPQGALLHSLINTALPSVYFDDSAHSQMAYQACYTTLFQTGAAALPAFLKSIPA